MQNEEKQLNEIKETLDCLNDNEELFKEEIRKILNENKDEYNPFPVPSILQLVSSIERNKKILKEKLEIVDNEHCPEVLRDYLLKHQMPRIKQDLELYQFGLDMAIYGYKLAKSSIDDNESKKLDNLLNAIKTA